MDWAIVALYVLQGFLGALVNVLMSSRSWADLTRFRSVKALIIGAIIGYIYYILVTDHGYPDKLMAFIAGYAGFDFIEELVPKIRSGVRRLRG